MQTRVPAAECGWKNVLVGVEEVQGGLEETGEQRAPRFIRERHTRARGQTGFIW